MKVVLFGPPGAGKGTQAKFICAAIGIPQISTGDMLRAAVAKGDEFGKQLDATMRSGALVDDATVLKTLKDRISDDDCQNGFLLDGFPRTINQAEGLESFGIETDCIIVLEIDDAEIVRRLSGRWVSPAGRIYHIETNPPKIPGIDDDTGEALIQRPDDKEETVIRRLEVYHKQTEPLLSWYEQHSKYKKMIIRVDSTRSVEQVRDEILQRLQQVL